MKKHSFLYGSLILGIAVVISKVLGLIFKIPLASILGGTGMGYFSTAYAIFTPVYALSVTGLPSAIARMVAENMAFERYCNVRKIRRVAILCFSAFGLFLSLLLILLAKPLTHSLVQNKNAYLAVIFIAPSIFFGCITSVYRGYYEGLRNMLPTAISQVIDAVAKLSLGLGLAILTSNYANTSFEKTGKVFGTVCSTPEEALNAALPFIAAASIIGVSLATLMGSLFLILRYRIKSDGITKDMLMGDPSTDRMRYLLKELIRLVIPIAIGSVITSLASLVDLMTIIRCLKDALSFGEAEMLSQFSDIISSNVTKDMLPNFIYGSYSGLALTVFNLIPSLTSIFGKSILPNVAEGWALNDKKLIKNSIVNVFMATSAIAIPAGISLSVLSKPVLEFLYSSRPLEISVASTPLSILSIGMIFLALTIPTFTTLQAIGRADLPVKIMSAGILIKIIGNLVLIRIPIININGAAIATVLSYLFICIFSIRALLKLTGITLPVMNLFIKPTFAGILCAASAYLTFIFSSGIINSSKLSLIISIFVGLLIYGFSLILLGVTTKKELLKLLKK